MVQPLKLYGSYEVPCVWHALGNFLPHAIPKSEMWTTWTTASFSGHLLLQFIVHIPDDDLWTTWGMVQRSHMWSWKQSRRWPGNEATFYHVWFLTTEFCQNAKKDGIMNIVSFPDPTTLGWIASSICTGKKGLVTYAVVMQLDEMLMISFTCDIISVVQISTTCVLGALHSLWILKRCHCMVTLWQYSAYWFDKERLLTAVIVRFFTVTNQAFAACHH